MAEVLECWKDSRTEEKGILAGSRSCGFLFSSPPDAQREASSGLTEMGQHQPPFHSAVGSADCPVAAVLGSANSQNRPSS